MQYLWAGYRIYEPFELFRRININFNQWAGWNFGGETIFKGGNINLMAQFKNYWSAGFGFNPGRIPVASALRGGPSLPSPGQERLGLASKPT